MREITLTVRGDTVHASRHRAGIQGEANATVLVVSFDESWDGYAKKITFWDALEQNPVERMLTVDLLVDAANDTRTYRTTIPGEPLALAGECVLVIEGYVDGIRARSMSVRLTVEEAPVADNAGEPATPTPTPSEQVQAQIEAIIGSVQTVAQGVEEVRAIAVQVDQGVQDAQRAAELAEGYASHPPVVGKNGNWWAWDGEDYVDTAEPSRGEIGPQGEQGVQGIQGPQGIQGVQGEAGPRGPQGEQGVQGEPGVRGERGFSGVYVGSGEMPENCNVQVDPQGCVVTIEDLIGPQGPAGAPGKDGADGAPGADGKDGIDGKDGTDGHTPEKGVDYFTPAEVEAIVADATARVEASFGGTYELVEEITTTEDLTSIDRTAWPDGTPYSFKGMIVKCEYEAALGKGQVNTTFQNRGGSSWITQGITSGDALNTKKYYHWSHCYSDHGFWNARHGYNASVYASAVYQMTGYAAVINNLPIDALNIKAVTSGVPLPAGTIIRIYGVRA